MVASGAHHSVFGCAAAPGPPTVAVPPSAPYRTINNVVGTIGMATRTEARIPNAMGRELFF